MDCGTACSYDIAMRLVGDPDAEFWLDQIGGEPGDFQWDAGNRPKLTKHHVDQDDVESMFHSPIVFAGRIAEPAHDEPRWLVLGQSKRGRKLALIVTRRGELLRPVSCRPMRRNERKVYEEASSQKGKGGPS
jgi:uncharacterized DUF497 family protein